MPISELLLPEFDEEMKKTRTTLERVPADKADFAPHPKSMPLGKQGKALFSGSRFLAYRQMYLNHLVHHRAQLGVYLRLNGKPVPSIYGPSADETLGF